MSTVKSRSGPPDGLPNHGPDGLPNDELANDEPPTDELPDDGLPEAELRELQQVLLGMLLDVTEVCEELGIRFFLGEGTLIGAIRHHGFVPWDDDLDLYMLRADYQRFLQLAPGLLAERYRVQHPATVDDYWSSFMKVRLVDGPQRFRQTHIEHLTADNGPLIDIFPVEYVPRAGGIRLSLQGAYLRVLRGCLAQKLALEPASRPVKRALWLASHLLSTRFLHHQLDWALRLHGDRPRPWLAVLASFHPLRRQVVPARVFASQEWVDFEGHRMPVPVGYDELLTTIYGDYRTPPPPAERGGRHQFAIRD